MLQMYLIVLCFMFFSNNISAKQINVVTTTGMIADLVTNIGLDKVKVISLMGTGVDPHLYKATHGDLRRLQNADIVFFNGLYLEGKLQNIFEKLSKKKPVFAVTASLNSATIMKYNEAYDPHVWFDVSIWKQAAQEVLTRLIEVDYDNKNFYQTNANVFFAKLSKLHLWVKQQISKIPPSQRVLITAHDAFGYFGRAYGVEVKALQGMSTVSGFGLNDIKKLKRIVISRKIKAVFVESSVPKRFLQSLVLGVQAEGGNIRIGGELYSDAMGLKGTEEGTYIGMVKHNVNTIVSALK